MALLIRTISEKDITSVVSLHRAVMGYSLNAMLGERHLASVYRTTAKLTDAFVRVAEENGAVVGAVSATLDEEYSARAVLRRMALMHKARVVTRLLISPQSWRAVWAARRASKPVKVDGTQIRACLTSIIVDPQVHGRGIGRALVSAVDDFMRQRGLSYYRLDTRAANTGARAFYAHLGFREHEQRGCDIIYLRKL